MDRHEGEPSSHLVDEFLLPPFFDLVKDRTECLESGRNRFTQGVRQDVGGFEVCGVPADRRPVSTIFVPSAVHRAFRSPSNTAIASRSVMIFEPPSNASRKRMTNCGRDMVIRLLRPELPIPPKQSRTRRAVSLFQVGDVRRA